MAVFVLDKHKKPLMPCTEKRARLLLKSGRARVHKLYPFTIRLVDRLQEESVLQPSQLKLDPGSKTTGLAVITEGEQGAKVPLLGEIKHKPGIKLKMDARRAVRNSRRNRHTRYRQPRFLNRHPEKCVACGRNAKHGSHYCRPCQASRNFVDNGYRETWLPPSLRARVDQTMHAVEKLRKLMPITAISFENVRFDTQLMENPEVSGAEYQQGELQGYEVREYLLEKWGRACVYCGVSNVPLEIEHIMPKSHGGSNRVSNLTLACHACNQEKNTRTAEEYGFPHIQTEAKKPLKDAAMMNATRWELYRQLKATDLPVEGGSGGRTKMQRIQHELPKEHYYDALCVGESTPDSLVSLPVIVQVWSAKGRGTRQMQNHDAYGFPIGKARQRKKNYFGFQTGDVVVANVPKGKHKGIWKGRISVRARGSFALSVDGNRFDVHQKYCRMLQRGDGWRYETKRANA